MDTADLIDAIYGRAPAGVPGQGWGSGGSGAGVVGALLLLLLALLTLPGAVVWEVSE